MKTKRSIRSIALLLVLCLCVTMLPSTVIAVEAEAPTAEKREPTLADVIAGVADLSDLPNPLDPILSLRSSDTRKHWACTIQSGSMKTKATI